jgi:signal transduction histidine kinase/ligand-binding sensor domain-containing protein
VLLFFSSAVNSQPYYFRHYQVEDGLSNNTVFCSIQDKKGFMWFGTKDGLNRFDGYRFKTFYIDSKNGSSLTRDYIYSLFTDKKGGLWVCSQKGLYRFDAEKERLVPFTDTLQDVRDVLIDESQHLWFISSYNVYMYDFETKRLACFSSDKYSQATSLCQSDDGTVWFATTDGYLQQFNNKYETFTSYDVFSHSPSPASRLIKKIVPFNGTIYIGTASQGVKQFFFSTSDYKDVLTYNANKTTVYVRDILHANNTEIWFATESGIFILNTATGIYTNLKKKYLDPYSLSDNAVYTLSKDSEGGIWAGTYFGGLNYFPKQYSSFQKYFSDNTKNSIIGSVVREICEDHLGNIWIGTEDAGLNKLDTKTGKITRFESTGSATNIAYSNIQGLLAVKDKLWIGTFEHGLDIMDIRTGKVIKHYASGLGNNDLKSNFIVNFLQTKNGDLYIAGSNALYKYNPKKDNFILCKEVPRNVFFSCIIEDHLGNILAGTHEKGIYYFNPVTKEKGHFENEPNNNNCLTSNSINAIYQDSFFNFWFATEGGGLCKLSKDKKIFTRFTTKEGLPSNFIFKSLEDNKKNLWITTSKGLVRMDLIDNTTTVYTKARGLLNDQFNYNSGYKDSQGKLYLGSVRGMITFKPEEFHQSYFVPPVYITGFQVHNHELEINKDTAVLKKSIIYTDKITLPYDQSSVSIDFAAISFASPEVTGYRYIMEGLEKDWTYIKSNRRVYFTKLEPGTYFFKLKAAVNGLWNKQEKKLTIQILPPIWATKWAYLIYIVVGASFVYYLVRTYKEMLINKKDKEIYEAKIEFFTIIAHEIRTPLTLIKGPVENLSEMTEQLPEIKEDVVLMERNTNRLVNLINQILDFRQTETKGFSLDFSHVNINEVLKETFITFEPLAKKRTLSYTIHLPSSDNYIMADPEALNKIFSNLFSNAIKYADKEVDIKLIMPGTKIGYLSIEICNDGFVIPNEMKEKVFEPFYRLKETVKQKGTGIGLALARSLAELHKGNLFVKVSEEKSNVFVLLLPVSSVKANFKKRLKNFR